MNIMQFFETYREFGVAGLFIVLFLFLFAMILKERKGLIRSLEKKGEDEVERVKMITAVVQANTSTVREQNELLKELKDAIRSDTAKQSELLVYLKAREGRIGGG